MRLSLLSSSLHQQNNEAVFELGYHLNTLACSPEQEVWSYVEVGIGLP